MSRAKILTARLCVLIAGVLLLGETLLGCIFVLGIGVSNLHDIFTDLCLTMAFPVFLICFKSLKLAVGGLWLVFVIQWIDICCNRSTPSFVNPLGWLHGDLLFASSILLTIATLLLLHRGNVQTPLTFWSPFDA